MGASDASLVSVLGQPISAGSQTGQYTHPKQATISVANSVATVESSDIIAAPGATVTFYGTTFGVVESGSVPLFSRGGHRRFHMVKPQDGGNGVFYEVIINRMGSSLSTVLGQSISTGSQAGTTGSPIQATISVGTPWRQWNRVTSPQPPTRRNLLRHRQQFHLSGDRQRGSHGGRSDQCIYRGRGAGRNNALLRGDHRPGGVSDNQSKRRHFLLSSERDNHAWHSKRTIYYTTDGSVPEFEAIPSHIFAYNGSGFNVGVSETGLCAGLRSSQPTMESRNLGGSR